jgi:hypothetical protein
LETPIVIAHFPFRVPVYDIYNNRTKMMKRDGQTVHYCIMDAINAVIYVLGQCRRFWDELDLLDSTALVIDPVNPSREITYRRIMLG